MLGGDTNDFVGWLSQHNCRSFSLVYSNHIQRFAADKGIINQDIMRIYFDYDEAYQTCLDKLAQAQKQQEK